MPASPLSANASTLNNAFISSSFVFASPLVSWSSCPKRRCCRTASTPYASSKPQSVSESTSILSWNVSSLPSLLRQDPHTLINITSQYSPAILCLQQTKIPEQYQKLFFDILPDYEYKLFSSSRGRFSYSGTATFSKPCPVIAQRQVRHTIFDKEGRFILLEYPAVIVANVFPPRSSVLNKAHMRHVWDRHFRKVVHKVRRQGKPLVIMGDLDVPYANPRATDREQKLLQQSFEDTLETCRLVDISVPPPSVSAEDTSKVSKQPFDRVLVSEDALPAVLDVQVLHHLKHKHHCPTLLHLHPALLTYDDSHMRQFDESFFSG